jgi:hypothetical protein
MDRKILVALPFAGLLVLTGCRGIDFSASAQCSNGGTSCSGNYQQKTPTSQPRTSAPVASTQAQPTATVAVTAPAPTVTPTVTDTPTTDAVIQQCLPNPSESTLLALAEDRTNDVNIATCLGVSNVQAFAQQLQESAVTAYEAGQGNSRAGVQDWVASSGPVRCPDGRDVSSLTAIYHQNQ